MRYFASNLNRTQRSSGGMRGAPGSRWDAKGLSYVGTSVHTVLREYTLDHEDVILKVPRGIMNKRRLRFILS